MSDKDSSGEEDTRDIYFKQHQIRGWIAVSAALLQGKGSQKRSVFFTDTGITPLRRSVYRKYPVRSSDSRMHHYVRYNFHVSIITLIIIIVIIVINCIISIISNMCIIIVFIVRAQPVAGAGAVIYLSCNYEFSTYTLTIT